MADNLGGYLREYLAAVFEPLSIPLVPFAFPEAPLPECYMVYLEGATRKGLGDQGTSEHNDAATTMAIIEQPWTVIAHTSVESDVGNSGLIFDALDTLEESVRLLADQAEAFDMLDADGYRVEFDGIGWQRIVKTWSDNKGSIIIEGLLTYQYTVG